MMTTNATIMRFVDREEELNVVKQMLRSVSQGEQLTHPIIEYRGKPGIGKTALLNLIYTYIQQELQLLAILAIDFDTFAKNNDSLLSWQVLEALLTKFVGSPMGDQDHEILVKKIEDTLHGASSLEELLPPDLELVIEIINLCKSKRGVILLDSLSSVSATFLDFLGQNILLPLTEFRQPESNQILFIIGSRERAIWGASKYGLWRRTKSTILREFSLRDTTQQVIGTVFQDIPQEIHNITNGLPLGINVAIDVLSQINGFDEKTRLSREEFGDYEARLVDAIVNKPIRELMVPDEKFRAFQVLSVLRSFDVDLPEDILNEIDISQNWGLPSASIDLIEFLRRPLNNKEKEYEYVTLDSESGSFKMDDFIRRTLALHMRIFYQDDYLRLSYKAVDYYKNRFEHSFNPYFLVEKLYNLADLFRLSSPPKTDIEIADGLVAEIRESLRNIITNTSLKERRRIYLRLEEALLKATDLNELIGDRAAPSQSYLVSTLKEYKEELFPMGMAILSFSKEFDNISTGTEQYKVDFQIPTSEIILSLPAPIRTAPKIELLEKLSGFVSINELASLGRVIRTMWLPSQIQEKLREHDGPIVIEVDDPSIPWELIHDGTDFMALRVPLGKRLRANERPKYRFQSTSNRKALLVGAINTRVPNFPSLEYAEVEVVQVKEYLQDANFTVDTLLAERATSLEFSIHVSSGEYSIIHFAGHTYHNAQQDSKGIILFDDPIELSQIKRMVEGSPLVFINSCKSGISSSVEEDMDYAGRYNLGIAGAFLQGGALACIGSIWKVLDQHGAQFAQMFYQHLFSSSTIGEALLRTKLKYRDQFQKDTNDRTWVAYVLYGDPTSKTRFGY